MKRSPLLIRGPHWAAVSVLLIGTLTVPALANLLVNGDFETGDTGPINGAGVPTDWFAWGPTSGWHHDDAGKVIDTKAIKFWWDDVGLWQDFDATAGVEYLFSVEVLNATDDTLVGWNGILIAEFYDSGDAQLTALTVDKYLSASDPVDQWVNVSGVVTAPAGTDYGRMILKIGDWTPDGVGGSLNLDNASVVPEPATLAVLLVLGTLAARRR